MGTDTTRIGNVDISIKSPADEFFKYFTRKIHHVSCQFRAEKLRFYVESRNYDERRKVTLRMFGNMIDPRCFLTVTANFYVTATEANTNIVTMNVECVNVRHDKKDRITFFFDALASHIRDIDNNLYRLNHTQNSIDCEYPAYNCFVDFVKACRDDAEVEVQHVDLVKGTTTMSLLPSTHIFMTKFITLKVTTTITPREDDKSCHVEWTTEAEPLSDNCDKESFFETTATHIRDIIKTKLGNYYIE